MNAKPLTFAQYQVIQPKLGEEDVEYQDQDELDDCDVIIFFYGDLQIIHGFPGDNPYGWILNDKSKLLHTFGECRECYSGDNHEIKKFLRWYDRITGDQCEYEEFYTHIMNN